MKKVSLLEPASKEFIEIALKRYGLSLESVKGKSHPQEDFLLVSEKYPIFVVADGVTLIQYLIDKKEYPMPSPAGDVARIFCEELIKAAEAKYESFQTTDIQEIFRSANEAVGKYNRDHGRTKETVDYWNNDFYAATAAFVVIKDGVAYCGSICDSYVLHFNHEGKLLLKSPAYDSKREVESPKFVGDVSDEKARTKFFWSAKRNGTDADGKLNGYGVVTGEEIANRYLNVGSFEIKSGDVVVLITDGYESYFQVPEFISFLTTWPEDVETKLKEFSAAREKENPDKFGHERSLIAVSL